MPAPKAVTTTTTAPKASTMSEADMVAAAWSTDPNMDIFFYVIIGLSYAATIVPSVVGLYPIGLLRFSMTCYLAYLAIMSYLDLDKKPKAEANIWNMNNWLLYSLRRPAVEFLISYIVAPC